MHLSRLLRLGALLLVCSGSSVVAPGTSTTPKNQLSAYSPVKEHKPGRAVKPAKW